MFPRRSLDQAGQTEPLGAFAALCGEEVKLLVEAVSDLLFEVLDMAPPRRP